MCAGTAPELEAKSSFVGRWMDILKPGYQRVIDVPADQRLQALEKEAVIVSLENLLTFPFVKSAVEEDHLTLHGLWNDTGEGRLEQLDAIRGSFVPV